LGAEIVDETRDDWMGTESTMVRIGPTVVEFAESISDKALLGKDAMRSDVLHSITFRVRDLEYLRGHFEKAGVVIAGADESHLLVAPQFAPDVRFGFTERCWK
jgi:hypothetical protein